MKGGGHRFTVTASTTVTTVSPLAITTVSTTSFNSSQSVTESTTVTSASSPTSISVAAVFESEARSNHNPPPATSDVTDSNNLARGNSPLNSIAN